MQVLKTILEQYRNGERGMPTYDELAAIADESSAKRAINAAIDELAREPGAVGFMHSLPPHHTRYVAGGSLGQIVSMARRRKDEGLASIAGGDHDGHARINGKPRLDTAEMLEMRVTEAMTRLDEAKADAKELRHALFVARDHMRVMANWVKFSDPAAYSWSCNAITIVNAVLERGEPK